MGTVDFVILALAVVLFGLVSRRLDGTSLTAPMVFVGAGMLVGPGALDLLQLELSNEVVLVIAEITLVLVLFGDAARIDFRVLRRNAAIPARLLIIGLPLTIAAGTLLALPLITDLAFWEAAILAVVLAPTDAALGQAVVTSPLVPARIRQALNVESGLNDGLSVPFLTFFVALAVVEEDLEPASFWVQFVLEQIGLGLLIGLAVGGVGGWLLARSSARGWVTGTFMQLVPLGLAIAAWGAATELGGNGFIAAFVAGLAGGAMTRRLEQHVLDFAEDEGQLLNLTVFFFFGAAVIGPRLDEMTWEIALYAVLSLTVIRMLPVAIALIGTHLRVASVAFVGWFGPRGIATIVLALTVLEDEQDLPGVDTILLVSSVAVLFSVVAHGVSAAPLARIYGRASETMDEDEPEMAPVPEMPARAPMLSDEGRSPLRLHLPGRHRRQRDGDRSDDEPH